VQDHENRYFLSTDFTEGELYFFILQNGDSASQGGPSDVTYDAGVWYDVEVTWGTDGTHSARLIHPTDGEIASASMSDSTWTSGEIGFDAYEGGSGGTVTFDYVTLIDGGSGGGGGGGGGTTGVIDSFEDGSLSEYSFDRGESGASIIQDSTLAVDGSYLLELSGTSTELISTTGLSAYPSGGDTFNYRFRRSPGAVAWNITYGVQDHDNRYYVQFDVPDTKFRLYKLLDGDSVRIDSTEVTPSADEWHRIEVDWQADGTHTVTLFDNSDTQIAQVSGTDTEWSTGGIGFDAYLDSGESVSFDYVTMENPKVLGDFETDLEGWSTSSSNSLTRMNGNQMPAATTRHQHTLEVSVSSTPEPAIENQDQIRAADLSTNHCLLADVLPVNVQNTDSPVTFRFRYHHTDPGGIEESHEMTVDQRYGRRICWDMSGLSDAKLESAERLDIVWYPTNHPPGSGFDHNGTVCIDNVHVTNNRNKVTHARKILLHRENARAHGSMVNQIIQSETATTQDGVYRYYDGTELPYHMEILEGGDIEETVDGETFRWTGESA